MLRKFWIAVAFGSSLVLGAPSIARASAEDVCYLPNGGGLENCAPLPPSCEPAGTVTAQCRADAFQTFFTRDAKFVGGRSVIHTDVTHLLAQAVGFSAETAYWIAAYDEATDTGTFTPYDMSGLPLSGNMSTATIDGLARTNFDEGGLLFHFHAPRNDGLSQPSSSINGLTPDLSDADTEVLLANVRSWALYTGSVPLCSAGITTASVNGDYATGKNCFVVANGAAGTIVGALASMGDQTQIDFSYPTGRQIVVSAESAGGPVTSESFDSVVGAHAPEARLGVYLHALVDRISHHVCTDTSALAGPDASGTFTEYMLSEDCVQPLHALRHMWETGVDYTLLEDKDLTAEAALDAVYSELLAFARARGVLRTAALDPSYRDALLAKVSGALQIEDAAARVTGISKIACELQFAPLPGTPICARR